MVKKKKKIGATETKSPLKSSNLKFQMKLSVAFLEMSLQDIGFDKKCFLLFSIHHEVQKNSKQLFRNYCAILHWMNVGVHECKKQYQQECQDLINLI